MPPAPVRLIYPQSGRPTAAVLEHSDALIDYKLFWIACRSIDEAPLPRRDRQQRHPARRRSAAHVQRASSGRATWKSTCGDSTSASTTQPTAPTQASPTHRQHGRRRGIRGPHGPANPSRQQGDRLLTWRVARRELRARLAASATGQKIETLVTPTQHLSPRSPRS